MFLFAKGEKVVKRALMIPFLAIYAKGGGGEHEPKAKGPHHHNFKKSFSIGMIFKLVSHYVQKGERVLFSKSIS
jgi:hypothetical protein